MLMDFMDSVQGMAMGYVQMLLVFEISLELFTHLDHNASNKKIPCYAYVWC